MASELFKDGEVIYVEASRLKAHLDEGWTTSDKPVKEAADTNKSGKLSSEEVRKAAELAGIEGFETKRIKTLKAELGYESED